MIKVFAPDPGGAAQIEQVVWIGEAMSGTSVADLRHVVNYLLVASFQYFGQDTGKKLILKIPRDDPRTVRITTLP